MNYIFLDVDGVLNNANTTELINGCIGIDPVLVHNLKTIVDATDACIILSSSWRLGMVGGKESIYIQKLREALAAEGMTIVDHTPICNTERGAEIAKYLNKHNITYKDKIVILDDEDDMLELMPWLVKTNWEEGLTPAKAQEAIGVLTKEEF